MNYARKKASERLENEHKKVWEEFTNIINSNYHSNNFLKWKEETECKLDKLKDESEKVANEYCDKLLKAALIG